MENQKVTLREQVVKIAGIYRDNEEVISSETPANARHCLRNFNDFEQFYNCYYTTTTSKQLSVQGEKLLMKLIDIYASEELSFVEELTKKP